MNIKLTFFWFMSIFFPLTGCMNNSLEIFIPSGHEAYVKAPKGVALAVCQYGANYQLKKNSTGEWMIPSGRRITLRPDDTNDLVSSCYQGVSFVAKPDHHYYLDLYKTDSDCYTNVLRVYPSGRFGFDFEPTVGESNCALVLVNKDASLDD